MKPHVERMIAEANELEERVDKLAAFMSRENPTFAALHGVDKALMWRQHNHMEGYLFILRERIARAAN
jgi:hypothetical protein